MFKKLVSAVVLALGVVSALLISTPAPVLAATCDLQPLVDYAKTTITSGGGDFTTSPTIKVVVVEHITTSTGYAPVSVATGTLSWNASTQILSGNAGYIPNSFGGGISNASSSGIRSVDNKNGSFTPTSIHFAVTFNPTTGQMSIQKKIDGKNFLGRLPVVFTPDCVKPNLISHNTTSGLYTVLLSK